MIEVDGSRRSDRKPPDMTWTKQELGEDLVRNAMRDYPGDWDDMLEDVYKFLLEEYWLVKEDEYPYKEETWDLRDIAVDRKQYLLPVWWPGSLERQELRQRDRVLWFQLVIRDYLPKYFDTATDERDKNILG